MSESEFCLIIAAICGGIAIIEMAVYDAAGRRRSHRGVAASEIIAWTVASMGWLFLAWAGGAA